MIIITFLILILISVVFYIFKYKKMFWATLILSFSVFYLSISGLLPKLLLGFLQNDTARPYLPEFSEKNAIVVLGGGYVKIPLRTEQNIYLPGSWTYSRILGGAKTYFACKKAGKMCLLILSGGDPHKTGYSEATLYKKEMLALGVAGSDIILEENSNNTFENAKFVSKIILEKGIDPNVGVFLVTSGFHIKRAHEYFSFFYIKSRNIASDYFSVRLNFIPMSTTNLLLTDIALSEYAGILRFNVYNFFKLNEK